MLIDRIEAFNEDVEKEGEGEGEEEVEEEGDGNDDSGEKACLLNTRLYKDLILNLAER